VIGCDLIDAGAYGEQLTLAPIPALPDRFALRVCSRYADARDPTALRVRYEATLDRDALLRLHRTLTELLAAAPASSSAQGVQP